MDNMCCANNSASMTRRASINWTGVIYFLSGFCALVDEVVWVRLLKLTLGNTVYATSIVVSTFMGGLALGALIMSRYSDRIVRHLRLYVLLETLVTISALSLPFILKLVGALYVWLYRAHHPSSWQLLIVQVFISAAILLIPTMLMGSTLPLLGRFVTALEKQTGRLVGRLYAINTLGATVGCFLAGFFLLRFLGVMGTVYAAAVVNLIVVFGGWFLARFAPVPIDQQAEPTQTESSEVQVVASEATSGRFYLLILAFFMSGFISIGYELLWMRSIIHLLSAFTYVFSAVLTIYLLGNVIGAGIGSGMVAQLKKPALGFAVTLSLLGLCGVFYLPLLLWWASKALPSLDKEIELWSRIIPFSTFLAKPLIQSVFLFLLPSVLMGIGFPLALQAWANYVHKVGRSTGTAYAANTIGAVVGGIITGFLLIPLLGLQLAISILGLAAVWIAAVMCIAFVRRSKIVSRFGLSAVAVTLTIVVARIPCDLFDKVVNSNPQLPQQLELVAVEEGVVTTVSLYRDFLEDTLYLYTSGQRVAGDTYFWRSDQKMLGHFPVLLSTDAKKVLSVGFGSGESTACLALHNLERIDCAEIAPEVVALSLKFFSHINLGDRLNEKVNVIYMDAKNYIDLTDIKYDAIVNDCIHPRQFAENASLYSREYFESARRHLNDKGLFMSWIPTHNVEPVSVLNSIFGTMMDVFPYITVWYMTPNPALYFLVVGSDRPQYFSPKHIENELLKNGVRESMSLIDINNNVDIFSCYIGDQNDLRRCIKSFTLNSDYSPFIEFTTDNLPAGSGMFGQFISDMRSDSLYGHIDWTGFAEQEKNNWLSDYSRLKDASGFLLLSNATDDYLQKLKYCMDGLRILPGNPALLDARDRIERDLLFICNKLIESDRFNEALGMAGNILQIYPQSAIGWIIRSGALRGLGDFQQSIDAGKMSIHLAPDNAGAHFHLGSVLFGAGQFDLAITHYNEALQLAEHPKKFATYNKTQMWNALATAYAKAGQFPQAIAAAEKALDLALSTGRKKMAEDIKKRLLILKAASSLQKQH
jgi:spermidine synthase